MFLHLEFMNMHMATSTWPHPLSSDHRVNLHTYKDCCSGYRLVEWTLNQSTSPRPRPQVIQMWQALLSEGILKHGKILSFSFSAKFDNFSFLSDKLLSVSRWWPVTLPVCWSTSRHKPFLPSGSSLVLPHRGCGRWRQASQRSSSFVFLRGLESSEFPKLPHLDTRWMFRYHRCPGTRGAHLCHTQKRVSSCSLVW